MNLKTYNFKTNKVILLGDTHELGYTKLALGKIPDGSELIHLGDAGFGFGPLPSAVLHTVAWLNTYNDLCKNKDVNMYIIRGNHDATYDNIWSYDKLTNVFLIKDFAYGIFPNGKKALFVGGGVSVDRCTRRPGLDYWEDESTPQLDNVDECDVVFAHDAPEYFNHPTASLPNSFGWYVDRDKTLMRDCYKQRHNMSSIVERSKAKTLFGGHFHNHLHQTLNGVTYRCLAINELYEYDAE